MKKHNDDAEVKLKKVSKSAKSLIIFTLNCSFLKTYILHTSSPTKGVLGSDFEMVKITISLAKITFPSNDGVWHELKPILEKYKIISN